MDIYIAWDGDHIGREVGRASLADDPNKLRQISQSIERGNLIWKSWVEASGGSIISYGGDEGRATVPASKIGELEKIRQQYAGAVDSSVSVGVGMKLSEADKSLMAAKLQGGDKIVLYSPDVEQTIDQAQSENKPKSEVDKLAEQYLTKADAPRGAITPPVADPAKQSGAHAGMSGASRPSMPSVDKPTVEASEHSQGEAMHALMDNQNPAPPEMTHAEQDLEELFHSLAAEGHSQEARDQAQQHAANANAQRPEALDEIREKVGEVLKMVKGQVQVIEQMKQGNPELYESFMGLISVMIEMAHQLTVTGPQKPGQEAPTPDELAPAEESGDEGSEDSSGEETKKSEDDSFNFGANQHDPAVYEHVARMRSPNREMAQAWISYSMGHTSQRPQITPELERHLAKFGVVAPNGYAYGADGRSMERGLGGKKKVAEQPEEFRRIRDANLEHNLNPAFGKSEVQAKPKSHLDQIMERTKLLSAHIRTLADQGSSSHVFKHPQGGHVMTGRDPSKPGKWRATRIDARGNPTGHVEAHDHHDAIKAAHSYGADVLSVQPFKKDEMKGIPKGTRHHLNLPVGTHKESVGQIKVQHEDGKEGWVQARAGQIMSADGHPISSRNPGGR